MHPVAKCFLAIGVGAAVGALVHALYPQDRGAATARPTGGGRAAPSAPGGAPAREVRLAEAETLAWINDPAFRDHLVSEADQLAPVVYTTVDGFPIVTARDGVVSYLGRECPN